MTEQAVTGVVARFVKTPGAEVTPGARLVDDLGLDSVDVLEVTVLIEQALGVTISDDELVRVTTVGDLVAVARAASRH